MSEQPKTYVSKVSIDENGTAVDIPGELFEKMNWKNGDVLVWAALPDNKGFVVSTIEEPNYVAVG